MAAIDALEDTSNWIAASWGTTPSAVAAGAVPYLRLLGLTAGGWLMCRSALIAECYLRDGKGDLEFFNAKLISTRFFADQYLVQCPALRHTVCDGSTAIEALSIAG